MALVTWGGDRLRIETLEASGDQITQEELSSGRNEEQGQTTVGVGSASASLPATSGSSSHQATYLLTS